MQNRKIAKPAKTFKAVLFDKDGVLIDSMESCLRAANEIMKHYGKGEFSREKFRTSFWGIRADLSFAKIFKGFSESKIKEIHDYYKKKRLEFEGLVKLYPSVIPVLEALKGKYKLGVITSTSKELTTKLLTDFGILKYFDVIVTGEETKPKPAPDPILKACKLLSVAPNESLYVGDTDADIGAGKAAGCMTVIITTSKTREELRKIKGILIIDDLKELKNIL